MSESSIPSHKKAKGIVLTILVGLFFFVLFLYLILPHMVGGFLRGALTTRLSQNDGISFNIENLRVSPLRGVVYAKGIDLRDGERGRVSINEVFLNVAVLTAIVGDGIVVQDGLVEGLDVRLIAQEGEAIAFSTIQWEIDEGDEKKDEQEQDDNREKESRFAVENFVLENLSVRLEAALEDDQFEKIHLDVPRLIASGEVIDENVTSFSLRISNQYRLSTSYDSGQPLIQGNTLSVTTKKELENHLKLFVEANTIANRRFYLSETDNLSLVGEVLERFENQEVESTNMSELPEVSTKDETGAESAKLPFELRLNAIYNVCRTDEEGIRDSFTWNDIEIVAQRDYSNSSNSSTEVESTSLSITAPNLPKAIFEYVISDTQQPTAMNLDVVTEDLSLAPLLWNAGEENQLPELVQGLVTSSIKYGFDESTLAGRVEIDFSNVETTKDERPIWKRLGGGNMATMLGGMIEGTSGDPNPISFEFETESEEPISPLGAWLEFRRRFSEALFEASPE